jgi:hypothetical protein
MGKVSVAVGNRSPVFLVNNSTTGRSLHETSRKKTAILVAVNESALSLVADELKADAAESIVT